MCFGFFHIFKKIQLFPLLSIPLKATKRKGCSPSPLGCEDRFFIFQKKNSFQSWPPISLHLDKMQKRIPAVRWAGRHRLPGPTTPWPREAVTRLSPRWEPSLRPTLRWTEKSVWVCNGNKACVKRLDATAFNLQGIASDIKPIDHPWRWGIRSSNPASIWCIGWINLSFNWTSAEFEALLYAEMQLYNPDKKYGRQKFWEHPKFPTIFLPINFCPEYLSYALWGASLFKS